MPLFLVIHLKISLGIYSCLCLWDIDRTERIETLERRHWRTCGVTKGGQNTDWHRMHVGNLPTTCCSSVGDQKIASLFYFILSTLHPCVAQVASASQNTHYHILLKHSCFNYLINWFAQQCIKIKDTGTVSFISSSVKDLIAFHQVVTDGILGITVLFSCWGLVDCRGSQSGQCWGCYWLSCCLNRSHLSVRILAFSVISFVRESIWLTFSPVAWVLACDAHSVRCSLGCMRGHRTGAFIRDPGAAH